MPREVVDHGCQFEGDLTVGPEEARWQGVVVQTLTIVLDTGTWIPAVRVAGRHLRKPLDGEAYDVTRRHDAKLLQADRDGARAGVRGRRDGLARGEGGHVELEGPLATDRRPDPLGFKVAWERLR